MANEVAKKHETAVELADTMLEQTTSSVPKLLCKKGKWSLNGEEIPDGKEFVAYPFDAMRGVCRWENDHVVDQHTGRIADKSVLKVEEDQLIFNGETFAKADGWQPQYAMPLEDPETGEVISFVSCATGAKIAVEKLIQQTASAIKKGGSDLTPLVRLTTGFFPAGEFGMTIRPAFELVPSETISKEPNDPIPF